MPIIQTNEHIPERFGIEGDISTACIRQLMNNPEAKVLQTSKPLCDADWQRINQTLIPNRPDITIRIYGHYQETCDLSVLRQIPDVEHLCVDSLSAADNTSYIATLNKLKSLSIGIYELNAFDFLSELPTSITELSLGDTKSQKLNLTSIKHLSQLTQLTIVGHEKNLEIIGSFEQLETLHLRSIRSDIGFIRALKKLHTLSITLGGIQSLDALQNLSNLKYLELFQIRGLSDISVIESLTDLQLCSIEALRNVTTFPNLEKLTQLRRLYLENMKGLKDISGLFNAPALEEFLHISANNITPEQYHPLSSIPSLKSALIGFGSKKKNQQMKEHLESNGIEPYRYTPFIFK